MRYRKHRLSDTTWKVIKKWKSKAFLYKGLLIHRFINGYDKGEVTAQAIVDDILNTIEHYFVVAKPLKQLLHQMSVS